MKNLFKKIARPILVGIIVFASFNLTFAANHPSTCDNESQWSSSNPPRYSHSQCPDGLGFAAFNAYRSRAIITENGVTLRDNEFNFGRIRKYYKDTKWHIVGGATSTLGYTNRINLTKTEGELGEVFIYMHNSGDPDGNPGRPDANRYDVVAENAKVKISGFHRNSEGKLISNTGANHSFTARIFSDNTIPITDTFSITTEANQYLELLPSTLNLSYCTNPNTCNSMQDKYPNSDVSTPTSLQNSAARSLIGSGLSLTSRANGQGANGDFFASEGYRQQLYFFVKAREGAPLCNTLDLEILTYAQTHPGSTSTQELRVGDDAYLRVSVNPDNPYLDDSVLSIIGDRGDAREMTSSQIRALNSSLDRTHYRYWKLTNWDYNTIMSARVPGHENDTTRNGCVDSVTFQPPEIEICSELELEILSGDPTPSDPNEVGDKVKFQVNAIPDDYNSDILVKFESPRMMGNLQEIFGPRKWSIENWNGDTRILAYVPDEKDGQIDDLEPCTIPLEFSEPEIPMCESLTLTVDPRDIDKLDPENQSQVGDKVRFQFNVNPDYYIDDISVSTNNTPDNLVWKSIVNLFSKGDREKNKFTVENWNEDTIITARVEGHEDDNNDGIEECVAPLKFNAPPANQCSNVTLTQLNNFEPNLTGELTSFRTEALPPEYIDQIQYQVELEDGTIVPGANIQEGGKFAGRQTINVNGWTQDSYIRAFVPNLDYLNSCDKKLPFPEVSLMCEELKTGDPIIENNEVRIPITELAGISCTEEEINVSAIGHGDVTLHEGTPGVDCYVSATGFNSESIIVIDGGEGCRQEIPLSTNQCLNLSLILVSHTETEYIFEATVDPNTYNIIYELSGNATYSTDPNNPNRIIVNGFDENTVLTATAEGSNNPDCAAEYSEFPTPPPSLCQDLSLVPDSFDPATENIFRFRADLFPNNFSEDVNWEIIDMASNEILETYTDRRAPYRFNTYNLNYNTKLRAYVDPAKVENGYSCEAEILPPEYTPECTNMTVVRPNQPVGQSQAVCPSDGSPIVLVAAGYGDYDGPLVWSTPDPCDESTGPIFSDGTNESACSFVSDIHNPVVIRGCNPNQTIQVQALNDPDCYFEFSRDGNGDEPGDLFKEVIESSFIGPETTQVRYRLTYLPKYIFGDIYSSVTLFDNITQGIIGQNAEFAFHGITPGSLQVPNSVSEIVTSEANITTEGDLNQGVTIHNLRVNVPVSIEYTATINSALANSNACEVLTQSCGEQFINTASTNYGQTASAQLNVLCPFILSRGFGDVYLEEDFSTGVDISKCSNRPSSEGPTFTPVPEENTIVSTGQYDATPSHHLCRGENVPTELQEYYGDDVLKSISSSVCEVGLTLAEKWQTNTITKDIEINIHKITRNLAPAQALSSVLSSLYESDLNKDINKSYNVFLNEGDLAIGSPDGTPLVVDGQAKTIIVRNGTLTINSNIEYAQATDSTEPPVIAFLVINGNIEIAPDVENLVGIYAAVKKDPGTGFIQRSTKTSNKLLTIQGSVFGDIEPLFTQTTATGNLGVDRGAVTVIYDGRIVQNTPPGLKDIVEFNQYQVVNGNDIFDYE